MGVAVRIDRDQWSGEGDFTEQLLLWLAEQPGIVSDARRRRVGDTGGCRV